MIMYYLLAAVRWILTILFYIPAWIVEGVRLACVWLLNKQLEAYASRNHKK